MQTTFVSNYFNKNEQIFQNLPKKKNRMDDQIKPTPFFLGEGGCLINTNFISHFLYSIIYYFNHNILCFIYLLFLNKIETNQTQFDT